MDAYTDSMNGGPDGKRWGFTPGALHLGGITIGTCPPINDPSDCQFGVPLDPNKRQLLKVLDLRTQKRRGELRDREEAIRARAEAKRDSTRGSGGG